ncbi:MAG: hypothetical protein IPJ87_07520 [Flavobacteriales bacterium]|nr:hypothetical protein [Flavobacteriales bacterium]MBK7941709.1 hypothetical protein [Flavobacteriales bacterium]MBK9700251.1 hypothetical protein [Flavobacteriales bacterium]
MKRTILPLALGLGLLTLHSCGGPGGGADDLPPLDTARWGQADCSILKGGVVFHLDYELSGQHQGSDVVTFSGDQFDCSACATEGLTQGEVGCYESGPGQFTIKAVKSDDMGNSRAWKGDVVKGVFNGEMNVSKADGSATLYRFTGRAEK